MRYALLLAILTATAHADDAQVRARKAAEQLEADAKATRSAAKYIACGQAYLDLHNKYPASYGDELLYNAGVCFYEGKAFGAALQSWELILRTFPNSKIAPRALARTAKTYGDIAQFDRAAERLEEYAKKYAGEKDAFDAMSDAVFYRRALGDRQRVIENTMYLVKTYGRKKHREAADAMLSLTQVYDGDPDKQRKHLELTLKQHKLTPEQQAFAFVKLGDVISTQSCPARLQEGLCVKIERDRGAAKKATCTKAAATRVVVVKRTASHSDAINAYTRATKLGGHYAAKASLALADVELEKLLELSPAPVDKKRLDAWVEDATKRGADVTRRYEQVMAHRDAYTSVVAAARIAQTTHAIARAIEAAPTNNPALCKALGGLHDPIVARAVVAYGVCVTKATELGIHDATTQMCQREANVLDPASFPPRELQPDPTTITLPMIADKIGEPDWRAGRRDAAIKAWEAALKKDGKLFAPRINLAIAQLDRLRALPATDSARKQLEADITFHAQNALAVEEHPAPHVVLAALALEHKHKLDLAHAHLQTATRTQDKYAPAHLGLGILAIRRDQFGLALSHFERAAELEPTSEPVALALALASLRVGRYDRAAEQLRVIKTASYDAELARGIAARGQGKPADAKAAYERAKKLDPARPEAPHNLGLLAATKAGP